MDGWSFVAKTPRSYGMHACMPCGRGLLVLPHGDEAEGEELHCFVRLECSVPFPSFVGLVR